MYPGNSTSASETELSSHDSEIVKMSILLEMTVSLARIRCSRFLSERIFKCAILMLPVVSRRPRGLLDLLQLFVGIPGLSSMSPESRSR